MHMIGSTMIDFLKHRANPILAWAAVLYLAAWISDACDPHVAHILESLW